MIVGILVVVDLFILFSDIMQLGELKNYSKGTYVIIPLRCSIIIIDNFLAHATVTVASIALEHKRVRYYTCTSHAYTNYMRSKTSVFNNL